MHSEWVTTILCYLFAILYGIWLQPETVFIRNACLIGGALLSLPIIYSNRKTLLNREALPIWLIGLLLLWVTFHLFFVGVDFQAQWVEYSKIWKKIAIGCVFALGLGLSIGRYAFNEVLGRRYWQIIYAGFMLPALIYFVKLGFTNWAIASGTEISPYLINSRDIFTDPFAIHRSGYVFFTLPALAIGLSRISTQIRNKIFSLRVSVIYLIAIFATAAIYVIESDRLGLLFVSGLTLLYVCKAVHSQTVALGWKRLMLLGFVVASLLFFVGNAQKNNSQWKTFFSDARIAVKIDQYDGWKYSPKYLPINDLGVKASDSNYKRIAWLIVGARLALTHPLGYGLMSQSFGRICKQIWPESQTSWSHSAWLDFTLGYGFPGSALLFLAAVFAFRSSKNAPTPWMCIGGVMLGIWITLFFVKELSSEVYVAGFIFVVVFFSSIRLILSLEQLKDTGG